MKRGLSWRFARRAALALAALALGAEVALRLTPFPTELETPLAGSAEFVDREGRPLRMLLADERRYSRRSALGEISPLLIDATLAAEDRRFHDHGGIDPRALGRALREALRDGRARSGASTITQQLVKLARPGDRTLSRKLGEMWLALRIERAWSKERILEEYLNRLDYGNLQVGIASASRYYFAKPPANLSAAEAAFLAALPRAPSRLDPHTHFDAAQSRQHWVLARMHATGVLDADAFQRALAEPLQLAREGRTFAAPHFVDLLLQRRGVLPLLGGTVRTTLDLTLNRFVERCLADQLRTIAQHHATSAAAVVIHNPTGDVLALAASGDYLEPGNGQVNGAWIVRSPGSAVKPFAYLLALEAGANPCTVVPDVPTDFPTESGLYHPNNYNHRFHGPVSLRSALGNSLNVAAIRALQLGGGPERMHRRLLDLGLTTLHHPTSYYGLGLTLGNGEVRLLELASAYATIGRLGTHRPFRLLLREEPATGRRVCDPRATFLVADMLADNTARAAAFGLNSYLAFDFPVACKTGTSSDYRDNWALGCTPEFTVGVWVGNMDGSPMRGITGVTGAAPVLHEIFTHLHTTRGTSWFSAPAGIESFPIHPLTGRLASADQPGTVREKCLWPPESVRDSDFDAQSRVILPPEYAPWMASAQNSLGTLAACADAAPLLRILQPSPGSVYFLDPDLPTAAQRIALRAEAAGKVAWSCATLPLDATDPRVPLREGRHIIVARDTATGRTAETWIEVQGL